MRNKLFLLVVFMLLVSSTSYCWTSITFGKQDSQVGYKDAVGPEDFITGPNSFRIYQDNLWVADSVNSRMICFNQEGKLTQTVNVTDLAKGAYISDFALQFSKDGVTPIAIWVLDQTSMKILKVDFNGKTLLKVENKGGALRQADEIDCDSSGRIYVGDYAAGKIVSYSKTGNVQRKISWSGSGFVLDANDNLHTIGYNSEKGNMHFTYSPDGKLASKVALGYKKMQNPRIWSIDKAGNAIVSLIPPSGNPTAQQLVKFTSEGKALETMTFGSPYYVNRYLVVGSKEVWVVKANYAKAPKNTIRFSKVSK